MDILTKTQFHLYQEAASRILELKDNSQTLVFIKDTDQQLNSQVFQEDIFMNCCMYLELLLKFGIFLLNECQSLYITFESFIFQ